MEGQTDLILEALGSRDRVQLLTALFGGARTEKELRLATGLDQTRATRGLGHLRLVGLVRRGEGRRAEYSLSFESATKELLQRAVDLADEVARARRSADQDFASRLPEIG